MTGLMDDGSVRVSTATPPLHDVLVIGGGPGGMSAALWSHRLGLKTVLLEAGPRLGGQLLTLYSKVVDYLGVVVEHGFQLVPHFEAHLDALKVPVRLNASVRSVVPCQPPRGVEGMGGDWGPETSVGGAPRFEVTLETGETLLARAVVVATGACRRWLEVPGEARLAGRGVSHSSTRDKHLAQGRRIAVVGGGDAAVEGALILAETAQQVTLIHRKASFRAQRALLERLLALPNVSCLTDTRVLEMQGESSLESLLLEQQGQTRILPVEVVYVRIGISPCGRLVKALISLDDAGYARVDAYQETTCSGLFVVGDLCNPTLSSVANAAGQGMIAAKVIQERLK